MATKTYKLGELARGGVITVTTNKKTVLIQAKEWDTSKGFSKGSDQSQAKEWNRLEVNIAEKDSRSKIDWFLSDLTTSYWTDEILKWIETKVDLQKSMFW
jgi:hypothetical protein